MTPRSKRSLAIVGAAALVLLPGGWMSEEARSQTPNPLSGFSIGGFNIGNVIDAAKNAQGLGDISEPQEIQMGQAIAESLLGAAPLDANTAEENYVASVGRWLAVFSGRPDLPWHFGILETETVGAFATPGGNIFITRGLIQRIHTESELAGVLGHEMAHVVQKHHLADIKKRSTQGLLLDLAQIKGGGGLKAEAARAFARVGMEGYVRGLSREDEMEADAIGVVIAARAGYEPYGLPSVLQTLATIPSSNADMALFLKTHPSPGDRLAALEQKLPPWFETLAKPNEALVRFNQTFKPVTACNQ
jgi:predicted Zn-dependent protease